MDACQATLWHVFEAPAYAAWCFSVCYNTDAHKLALVCGLVYIWCSPWWPFSVCPKVTKSRLSLFGLWFEWMKENRKRLLNRLRFTAPLLFLRWNRSSDGPEKQSRFQLDKLKLERRITFFCYFCYFSAGHCRSTLKKKTWLDRIDSCTEV